MNKNSLIKYKEDIFSKFIRKIKVFFTKNEKEDKRIELELNKSRPEEKTKDRMLENLKVNIDSNISTEYEKRKFMERLTNNPELLENFSNERLEKILQYYLEENEKKKKLLRKIIA